MKKEAQEAAERRKQAGIAAAKKEKERAEAKHAADAAAAAAPSHDTSAQTSAWKSVGGARDWPREPGACACWRAERKAECKRISAEAGLMREHMQYIICWVPESRCLNQTPAFKQSVRRFVHFLCFVLVLSSTLIADITRERNVKWDSIQHLLHLSIAQLQCEILCAKAFIQSKSTALVPIVRRLLTPTTSAVPWHHLRLRELYSPLLSIKSTYPLIPQWYFFLFSVYIFCLLAWKQQNWDERVALDNGFG